VPYTAFASQKGQAVSARLIVRRVKDMNRKAAAGQDELFACWRYHAVFTDNPFLMLQAEGQHRDYRRGAGVRGPDQRPPRPPAVRLVRRERGLGHLRGHVL